MHLTGKLALVTGAGRGIGRAIALALAEAGADVALLSRTPAELEATAEAVRHLGRRALPIVADIADRQQVDEAVRQAGPVAVLVNNAGVAPSCKFAETTDDMWHGSVATNLNGPFYLCRAILPHMLDAGWGRIINIASTAAKVGYKYNAAYVAAKHGLLGLTRALALEVAWRGVTVNAVCPGFVETDLTRRAVANIAARTGRPPDEARAALEAMSPQHRLMTADEVAWTVLFLTGEGARGINGQAIVIDGGGVQA